MFPLSAVSFFRAIKLNLRLPFGQQYLLLILVGMGRVVFARATSHGHFYFFALVRAGFLVIQVFLWPKLHCCLNTSGAPNATRKSEGGI